MIYVYKISLNSKKVKTYIDAPVRRIRTLPLYFASGRPQSSANTCNVFLGWQGTKKLCIPLLEKLDQAPVPYEKKELPCGGYRFF